MDSDFKAFVDGVKDKVDLVDLISKSGKSFDARKRGRYIYCKKPDSLAVDVNWGVYTWFAKPGYGGKPYETGDHFDWLERYEGMDFNQALEYLCEIAGVRIPDHLRRTDNRDAAKAAKVTYEMMGVVHEWFVKQLFSTPAALAYARGRGWSDEILRINERYEAGFVSSRGEGVGFSGGSSAAADDLAGTFDLYGLNKKSPEAVAILGMRGGVAAWCRAHGIEAQNNWLEQDRIWGLVDFPRLIYGHRERGKVVYFSGRNLKAEGDALIGESGKHKSYNPPQVLAGDRVYYFNHLFHWRADQFFVVEGQADAITLAQWGYPAVALMGLGADMDYFRGRMQEGTRVFVALDADEKGQEHVFKVAAQFGPLARVVDWGKVVIENDNEADDE